MVRLARASSIVAIVTLVTGASAQQRPDFSGDWTIEEPAGRGGGRGGRGQAPDMGSGWGRAITIAQDTRLLTVEYEFFSRGDLQPPLKFRYALDGSPTTNRVMMGRGIQERTSTTAWSGDTLVITTTQTFPHPDTGRTVNARTTRRLFLESPGALRVESTIAGVLGGPSSTSSTVYTKR